MLKDKFIDYLRFEKRFSPHTIKAYENDLAQFAGFMKLQYNSSHLSGADYTMIRSWLVSLLELHFTARSVNRKLSTLKSFYHFCIRNGFIEANPMLKVISPKTSKHLPVYIEKDKLEQLFSQVNFGNSFEAVRDRLLIMMFYATGMRRAELIGIKENDIDWEKFTVKVLGKRNKERIIPLGSYLCHHIDIYLKERNHFFTTEKESSARSIATVSKKDSVHKTIDTPEQNNTDYLFVCSSGNRMYARLVYSVVHKYLSLISSQVKLSPHVLRHTFATHMLNDGADLNAIKEILGHTSLAATQVYTHNSIEKLKLIYKQAHPRA